MFPAFVLDARGENLGAACPEIVKVDTGPSIVKIVEQFLSCLFTYIDLCSNLSNSSLVYFSSFHSSLVH